MERQESQLNLHSVDREEALRVMSSQMHGLSSAEVSRRLEKYGANELVHEERVSPIVLFLRQFQNVLIIILLIATALSLLVGEKVDAAIIAVIVVFSAVLGFIQEYRAERALDALKKMLNPTARAVRDGRETEVDASAIVPGDVLLIEAGDRVPADARVLDTSSLKCDEAPLTGESVPVEKTSSPLKGDPPVAERANMVYTGTIVNYGRARVLVASTGMQTEFGRIAREVSAVKTVKTPLEYRTEEIGKWLGIISIIICVLVIGVSLLREIREDSLSLNSFVEMLMFGVALAVAAVPEALAAIVTGALAIGMHEMTKHNALVRKMPAVETLGCTTVICSDKTGTLTKGQMTVRRLYTSSGFTEVSGAGYETEGEMNGPEAPGLLMECAVLCNDASLNKREGVSSISGDPTEAALLVLAEKAGLDREVFYETRPRVAEIPFSSERKLMSTINSGPDMVTAYIKGAPERVLERSAYIETPEGPRPLSAEDIDAAYKANEAMAASALRVLALAYRRMETIPEHPDHAGIESDLVFIGLVGMMDPPRPEAIEAIRVCKKVHMKTVMITGDHRLTAMSIAREMGMFVEGDMALTGEELSALSMDEFEAIVDRVTVYARVSPMDKLKIVTAWKDRGEVVAMTGDGVNDAPALKHADIGIAMGISGTEVAKEAADMVLLDDNFATIVSAIERGRWIYDNIRKYLTYLLRCNITEVIIIGGSVLWLGPEYLPLLPAAILYINLATDGLPALALGVAPPDPDLMSRPPRDPRKSIFSGEVVLYVLMAVVLEVPFFVWMYSTGMPDMELVRTRMFFMFVLLELLIVVNFRSLSYSLLKAPPHKWLLIAILWEMVILLALMQVAWVRDAFGISIPSGHDLALIGLVGVIIIISMEAFKLILRINGNKQT